MFNIGSYCRYRFSNASLFFNCKTLYQNSACHSNKSFVCSKIEKKNMNAIRIEKFGSEDVLQFKSGVEKPKVTLSTILVKMMAAGVNPVDTYIRSGAFGYLPVLPFTPGKDGAGLVEKVGENVSRFKEGDRIFVCGKRLGSFGTYAEYSLVSEADLFSLDGSLSFEEGAAIGIPYFTAYRALVVKGKIQAGETVLVHGASGAVGLASVQIAKSLGLVVIGTAGTPEGMALVKASGAHFVLCHREKNYMEKIMEITDNAGVNIIIEMLANVNLDKDMDVVASHGRIAIVGNRGSIKIDPRKMMGPEICVFGVSLFTSNEEEWKATSAGVLQGIQEGWVKPVIDKKYSLQDAPQAHKDIVHNKGAKGKLVLSIQQT